MSCLIRFVRRLAVPTIGVVAASAPADVLEVPKSYPTIQAAIVGARDGDVVLVDAGVYAETIDFLGKAITVRSLRGPHQTTIDAAGVEASVVTCALGEGPASTLEGFTLTGGAGTEDEFGQPVGGGLYCLGSDPTILRCRFVANESEFGGAVFLDESAATLIGCAVFGNEAGFGGGLFANNSTPDLVNCTLFDNMSEFGGSIYATNSPTAVANCILWGNRPNEIDGWPEADVRYSVVRGGWPGRGNLAENPRFADADGRLSSRSPGVDAGDNRAVEGLVTLDLDQRPRFVDDRETPDTGRGSAPITDIGAYEFPACFADVNGDGIVDVADLLRVLLAWGPCPGCPEDLDGNDVVDLRDLLFVITEWGPCPEGKAAPRSETSMSAPRRDTRSSRP